MAKRKKNKIEIKQGGLGSKIETFTDKTGIKKLAGDDCGCKERIEMLNNLFPQRFNARPLTEAESKEYKIFKDNRTLKISQIEINYLCELYASVFNKQLWKPDCYTCQGTVRTMLNIIERLDKVYEACNKQ